MKKIIALIAVFATVFSFSACKMNRDLTAEEIKEKEQVQLSKEQAQSMKAEQDFTEGVEKHVGKLGVTEKNKRLVVKVPSTEYEKYFVFEFNKKKIVDERYIYKFYYNTEFYEAAVSSGDGESNKLIKKDDKARMVVHELELQESDRQTFDYLYDLYSSEDSVSYGYEIIK